PGTRRSGAWRHWGLGDWRRGLCEQSVDQRAESLGVGVLRGQRGPLVGDGGQAWQPGRVEAAEGGRVAVGGPLAVGPLAGGVCADEDLADGVVPDAAEDADGL